jgi:hypothetical protein
MRKLQGNFATGVAKLKRPANLSLCLSYCEGCERQSLRLREILSLGLRRADQLPSLPSLHVLAVK